MNSSVLVGIHRIHALLQVYRCCNDANFAGAHRLENLFTEAILADETEFKECVDDIKAECESFGSISNFFIPRKDDLQNRPESDVGVCFVRYEMITSAAKAYEAINGRDFDGNTVKCTFLPAGSI